MNGSEAIKKGIRRGVTVTWNGRNAVVLSKTRNGVYTLRRSMYTDLKGRTRAKNIKEFVPWPNIINGYSVVAISYPRVDRPVCVIKGTVRKSAPRKKATARKSKPKARKPLSKRAFLERMAKGRAAAARKRNRGR